MKMTDPISLLFSSDHHFGILNINQEEMASAFHRIIFPLLDEIDVYFINGDFFDTLVNFDNYGFDPIYDTIIKLFDICEQKKIILRILQGTWTHDRNQCHRFRTFYRNGHYTFDFKFVEGIVLEEIFVNNRDLRILYVQDDLPYTDSADVVEVIQAKMVDVGWDHVDYGCMHGFFDFTAGGGMSRDKTVIYREEQFPFVRKIIDVGHVHQYQQQGKVISNGSFDRAVFGDENPKGVIKIIDYPDHYTAQFVENTYAAVYDTLMITKDDTTETITQRISAHLSKVTTDRKISLRFIVDLPEHREAIKVWMKATYPEVRFQFKKSTEADDKSLIMTASTLLTPVKKRVAPTPGNIATFIRAYIPDSYVLSVEAIEQHLQPVVDRK